MMAAKEGSAGPPSPSRIGRRSARLALFGLVGAAGFTVALTLSPYGTGFARSDRGRYADSVGYLREIERMRAGETFYEASASVLAEMGYPTAWVFNWRMPLPMAALAKLPDPALGRIPLAALALGMLALGWAALRREAGPFSAGLGAVLLTGTALPALIGDLYVQPVLWAGLLIGLSAGSLGAGLRKLGVAAGVAAPLFREFAVVWTVGCLVLAWLEGRRREAAVWLAGVAAFGGLLLYHAVQVRAHMGPDPLVQTEGWLQWGGLPFVLSMFQMNGYLLLLPQWVTALFFVLCLVGVVGWRSAIGLRVGLALALYVLAFSVVGRPYNQYWGLIFAPLACLGAGRGIHVLVDLWGTAFRPPRAQRSVGSG